MKRNDIEIIKLKNSFDDGKKNLTHRDVKLIFKCKNEINGLISELQFVHKEFLQITVDLKSHIYYEVQRDIDDLKKASMALYDRELNKLINLHGPNHLTVAAQHQGNQGIITSGRSPRFGKSILLF